MRDLVSCFSESAINISPSFPSHHPHNFSFSCSSSAASTAAPSSTSAPSDAVPSTQTSVSSLYKIYSHNKKPVFLSLTWTHHGLTVSTSSPASFKLNTASGLFRKKKGSKSIDDRFEIHWDLSAAKYDSGRPEPVSEFYLVVLVDSEVALVLGDDARKFSFAAAAGTAILVSRQEHCSGSTVYSTRTRFCESGSQHDILIKCSAAAAGGGGGGGRQHPVLSVSIDKKVVIRVKRLQWNFRGNQTIFVDGLLVDLMWDVHDWFFNPASAAGTTAGNAAAAAVFMFRPGGDLMLTSRIRNTETDGKPFTFTFAYNTYFSVTDISEVRVEGLETLDYLDNLKDRDRVTEQGDAITFESEVDKLYLSTPTKIAILDHERKRTFVLRKDGLPDAIVWNPWDKRAKAMVDLGDEEYKHMLLIGAACVEKPITLKPGEEWKGRQELSVVPSSYCSGQLDPRKVLRQS